MSSSVELARLRCDNSRLEYEKSQLYKELREVSERKDLDDSTIRSLRQEISRLNLVSVTIATITTTTTNNNDNVLFMNDFIN